MKSLSELASEVYLSWKASGSGKVRSVRRATPKHASTKNKSRDPIELGQVLTDLARDWGWGRELQEAEIISDWESIVGDKIAARTTVVSISSGVITVECSSTSWATELKRIRGDIVSKISRLYPESGITDLRFMVSGIPSWRHGYRSVKGQGPRDTYK